VTGFSSRGPSLIFAIDSENYLNAEKHRLKFLSAVLRQPPHRFIT